MPDPCRETYERGGDVFVCELDRGHEGDHQFVTTHSGDPYDPDGTRVELA